MSNISDSLQSGLGALSAFSHVLNEVLGSIDQKVGGLGMSLQDMAEQISKIVSDLDDKDDRLRALEGGAGEHADHVAAALNVFSQNIDGKLSSASQSLHKEIVTQRAMNKMDINSLRGKMTHSMSEALATLPAYEITSNPPEDLSDMAYLHERMRKMEEALSAQASVNTAFTEAMNSDEALQKVYDSLYEEIIKINARQTEQKAESVLMKQQMRELKTVQREHERLLAELHQALVNEQRMDQLKTKITERKSFAVGTRNLDKLPMRRTPNTDMMNEQLIYGAKGSVPAAAGSAEGATAASAKAVSPASAAKAASPTAAAMSAGSTAEAAPAAAVSTTSAVKPSASAAPTAPAKTAPPKSTKVTDTSSGVKKAKKAAASGTKKVRSVPAAVHEGDGEEGEAEAVEEEVQEEDDEEEEDEVEQGGDEAEPTEDAGTTDEVHEQAVAEGQRRAHSSASEAGDAPEPSADAQEEDYYPYPHEEGSIFSENNSVTDYYYGRDMTKKLLSALEARTLRGEEEVQEMKDSLESRLNELEGSVNIFKRLALMMDDLKIGYDALRNKMDGLAGESPIDDKLTLSLYAKIKHSASLWNRVHAEMVFGLDNIPDSEKDFLNKGGALQNEHLFFKLSLDLVGYLDRSLDDFIPRETLQATLRALYPTLLRIYESAEVLVDMDSAARGYVLEALQSSVVVLDHCIHPLYLHQSLQKALAAIETKADKQMVITADHEIRAALLMKVDHLEFVTVTSRLASSQEVQRLQAQITDRLSTAGGVGTHSSVFASSNAGPVAEVILREQPEFMGLEEKMFALGNKFIDLQAMTHGLVSKEEVHEALKAIIGEVKSLRRSAVMLPVFKEGLKMKADHSELDKLVKQITLALGNINLTDFATSSAAVHAKCLICDKPVSAQRSRSPQAPAPVPVQTQVMVSRSMPSLQAKRKGEALPKLTNASERAKVATELNILRTAVQEGITDSMDSPRSVGGGQSYKNRIRSSAGGGMGPGYTSGV